MTEKETEQNMLMEFIADTCYIDINKKNLLLVHNKIKKKLKKILLFIVISVIFR